MTLAETVEADVLLLDVSMPGPGVLDVIQRLKRLRPRLKVLVLSVHPEGHYARRVLMAGADGYLTKNHSSQALASAIRQVHSGRKYVTPSLAQELALDLAYGREGHPHETLSEPGVRSLPPAGRRQGGRPDCPGAEAQSQDGQDLSLQNFGEDQFAKHREIIFYAVNHQLVTEVVTERSDESEESAPRVRRRARIPRL